MVQLLLPSVMAPTDLLPSSVAAAAPLAALAVLFLLGVMLGFQMRARRRARRAATAAQVQLRTMTATMREGVVAYDLQLRLSLVNPAFERLTGYPAEDLQDQEFLQYVHPDDRAALLAEWDRLSQGATLRDQEYRVVARSGQVRWSSASWEPLRDERGRQIGYLGTEYDITERKLAEEAMQQDTELFQAVIQVQQAVAAAGLDSPTVMRVIAERSMRLTGASGAVIETIEGENVVPRVNLGTEALRLTLANSLSGVCVRTGELQRCDNIEQDPRIGHRGYQPLGIKSLLCVPLKDEQRIVGVLKVVSPKTAAFSERDEKALRLLGGVMGAALGHAAAFEARQSRLEERTRGLQDTEQRFKQLVDGAHEGIWMADERGVITYVNQCMAELLGYKNGALLGHPVSDFIDPGSRTGAQRVLAQSPATGDKQDVRFRRRDGSELWGLVSASPIFGRDGAIVGTVGMLTDITDRKRTEDRLRGSAERLAILHDLDQAILTARSPAEVARAALVRIRRMVPCERCSLVLFDFDRGQAHILAGYSGNLALPPETILLDDLAPQEVLRQGVVRYQEDITTLDHPAPVLRRLAEGGMRSLVSVPLLVERETIGEINLAAPTVAAFDAEHRDVALEVAAPVSMAMQQTRLREELGNQTGELERRVAERGAALRATATELETLLYSVSHDLRMPVRHIGGFADLLLQDGASGLHPTAQHYAERIREGAGRMASLLDDLVNVARVGRQDLLRRAVNFNTLVDDVIGQLQPELEGRSVDWQIEELPVLDCDPSLARLALLQLLSNAVKFTRTRERAIIRIRPIEADEQKGIAVEDNGVGFKMTYAAKLFGLFQRLHRPDEFEGNGAGLAVVQRIAQRHGGRVWAESEVDRGAKFFLTLSGAGQKGSGAVGSEYA